MIDEQETSPHILIVDDEPTLTRALARVFEMMDYHASVVGSGEEALDLMQREQFDLVLLDLRMPDIDGLEILAAAQALAPGTPFVILTAHGSLDSAITSMRRGAFDYLLKPCPVNEIIETVKRGLENRRRTRYQERLVGLLKETLAQVQAGEDAAPAAPEHPAAPPTTGPITLDTQWRAAIVNGELIKLSNTEYNLLAHFARHLNQVISCRELMRHTRGLDLSEREARPIIRMHIHRLRQKIEPNPSQPRFLRTVRGVGYMLVNDDKA